MVCIHRIFYAALLLFWAEDVIRWAADLGPIPPGYWLQFCKVVALLLLTLIILVMMAYQVCAWFADLYVSLRRKW